MSLADTLGAPVGDAPDELPPVAVRSCHPPSLAIDPPNRETPRSVWRRWATAAIALVIGAALGWLLSWALLPGPATPPVSAGTAISPPPGVGAFAEFLVAVHLSGTAPEQDLAALYRGENPVDGPTGLWVSRAATVSSQSLGGDVWLTTVVTDVLEATGDVYESGGLHYYQIVVDTSGSNPVALSAPARIPGPAAPSPVDNSRSFVGSVTAEQERAAATFLDAYLTQNGDAARYTQPETHLVQFEHPPYESIRVTAVNADPVGNLRVRLDATSASGSTTRLDYLLAVTSEHGSWEVAAVQPVGGIR